MIWILLAFSISLISFGETDWNVVQIEMKGVFYVCNDPIIKRKHLCFLPSSVKNKKEREYMNTVKFNELKLSPEIMTALKKKNIENTTPVQAAVIPAMLEGKDIIAKAPTGTGKTFAFGIPILERIDAADSKVQALILAPTRELALQIAAELRFLSERKQGVKVTSIYGGQSIELQIKNLKKGSQIVVATPGRLLDHLGRRTIRLDAVKTAVLDEADRMVDMGFFKEVTKILDGLQSMENLALLSATISRDVMTISWKYQRNPFEVTVPEDKENKPDILQYSLETAENQKADTISKIIKARNSTRSIVFCNTKHRVKKVTRILTNKGYLADCIHGDVRQGTRERVLSTFRKGQLNILVATDVAARGIDVTDIDTVFNYDIPLENEYYTHRIGRTGRAKRHVVSYTFVSSVSDSIKLSEIIKRTKSTISPVTIDEI